MPVAPASVAAIARDESGPGLDDCLMMNDKILKRAISSRLTGVAQGRVRPADGADYEDFPRFHKDDRLSIKMPMAESAFFCCAKVNGESISHHWLRRDHDERSQMGERLSGPGNFFVDWL